MKTSKLLFDGTNGNGYQPTGRDEAPPSPPNTGSIAGKRRIKISIEVDTLELDIAIAKAERLAMALEKINTGWEIRRG